MNNRIVPIFALIITIVIFFAYVRPQWNGPIASAKAAIADDTQALAAAKQYAARQNELASERNAIDPAALDRLTTLLPDSVDNVGTILDLDALAARSGLSLSHIDVAADTGGAVSPGAVPSGASPVSSVDLTISAIGSYAALQSFLSGVELSQRLLDVELLSVRASDTGIYTYQMRLRLYWLR